MPLIGGAAPLPYREVVRQTSPIRVVVADDHEPIRKGIVEVLVSDPVIVVVAEAGDGLEAVEMAAVYRPDVVVLDIGMPRLDGIKAAQLIRTAEPASRILVLTVHEEEDYVVKMVRAGASGYLLKENVAAELVPAVHALREGRHYFGQHALHTLLERLDG